MSRLGYGFLGFLRQPADLGIAFLDDSERECRTMDIVEARFMGDAKIAYRGMLIQASLGSAKSAAAAIRNGVEARFHDKSGTISLALEPYPEGFILCLFERSDGTSFSFLVDAGAADAFVDALGADSLPAMRAFTGRKDEALREVGQS